MKFGSLFSGIGGIDLGLERAGMTCVWQSEIEPYACQVLKKHWPDIPNLGDIREIDWTRVERADVVAGGYPCQPFSKAGRRAGEDDPRHLWPMFAECLRMVRPRFALLENVASHLSLGFGSVLSDLAEIGYGARWDCIPAAAVGAPHLRDRVFVIARLGGAEQRWSVADSDHAGSRDPLCTGWNAPWHGRSVVANAASVRQQKSRQSRRPSDPTPASERKPDKSFHDGFWSSEPNVGRVANGIPHRVDRLRGLGNAVVPQVAEHIGRIIMEANNDR